MSKKLAAYFSASGVTAKVATSGGSEFGKTVEELKISVPDSCEIIEGKLLNGR